MERHAAITQLWDEDTTAVSFAVLYAQMMDGIYVYLDRCAKVDEAAKRMGL